MVHSSWYPTGGDWTYIEHMSKIHKIMGYTTIPFSSKNSKNQSSDYSKYFLEERSYLSPDDNGLIRQSFDALTQGIFSREAIVKTQKLTDKVNIEFAHLNSIHNVHTLAILPILVKAKIPIVWRILDYKILCPNRTLLSHGKICERCITGNYFHAIKQRCKNGNLAKSTLMAFEAYFNQFKKYYDLVDAFSVQNDFSAQLLKRAGIEDHRIHTIENPFKLEDRTPEKFSQRNYEYDFGYFGRLSDEKGIVNFLSVVEQFPEKKFVIIGKGPLETEVERCASLFSNLTFLGAVWNEELYKSLRKVKFTIVPSVWQEVSPYSILQSYDVGIPVIGSDVGGIPELIQDRKTGFIYSANDMKDLKRVLKIASSLDEESYISLKANCKNYLDKHHSYENYIRKYADLLRDIVK